LHLLHWLELVGAVVAALSLGFLGIMAKFEMGCPNVFSVSISLDLGCGSLPVHASMRHKRLFNGCRVVVPVLAHFEIRCAGLLSSLILIFKTLLASPRVHLGIIGSFGIRLVLSISCLIVGFG